MTVGEAIKFLSQFPSEMLLIASENYGMTMFPVCDFYIMDYGHQSAVYVNGEGYPHSEWFPKKEKTNDDIKPVL